MNEEVMNRALTAAKSNLDNYKTATPEQLRARVAELEAQIETERMRLAACGVVALANTRKSAAKAREMLPEYRSASLEDVIRAVDSEMLLRDQLSDLARLRDVDAAQHQADEIEWNMQLAEAKRLCSIAVSDMQLEQKTANEVRAQLAETEALEIAHGERIEKLTKLLLLAKDVIEKAAAMTGHPDVFNYLQEALAAINDSKAVDGLILCDAKPVTRVSAIADNFGAVYVSLREPLYRAPEY